MIILKSEQTTTKVLSKKSESPTLKEAQEFIGGYVEMAPSHNPSLEPVQVLVDEEGLLKKLAPNPHASLTVGYTVYGNAIILTEKALWK